MAEEINDEFANPTHVRAADAYMNLVQGNVEFLTNHEKASNVSPALVERLFHEGQAPYAVVVTCSDSRVVPEHIFMCSLGDLFTVRSVGGVIGATELASVVYACDQLNVKMIVVLGHTHCGAIQEAMSGEDVDSAALQPIIDGIAAAIEGATDQFDAASKVVRSNMAKLAANEEIADLMAGCGVTIKGAVYYTENGTVEFLD